MIDKKLRHSMILTVLTLLWMTVIFLMSGANDEESREQSGSICTFLCEVFVEGFEDMPPEQQQALKERISFPVRKGAHLTEYAILGALLTLTTTSYAEAFSFAPPPLLLPLIIGALYAVSDEIHQLSVPGRAGQPRDVLIDTTGVLTGILLVRAAGRLRKRRNTSEERNRTE